MDIKEKLKQALIDGLNLEDMTPADISDDEILFGDEGLALDSLDAVELVVIVQRHFGVEIRDMDEGREAFASLSSLAKYIEDRTDT